LFPDVTSFFGKSYNGTVINNSSDMSMYLLAEALVSTVPGDAFGDNDCIRFSFAASEADLAEAMARIKAALAKLQ